MTVQAMTWALAQNQLEPLEKFVLLALCDMTPHGGSTTLSAERIARYTNLPLAEIPALIERLISSGLLMRSSLGTGLLVMPVGESEPTAYRKKAISPGLRMRVFERDRYRCLRCGSQADLRADHVVPERLGGATTFANLQTLCATCNSWKGTKTIDFRVEHEGVA